MISLDIDEASPCKEVRVVAEVLCTPTLTGRLVQGLYQGNCTSEKEASADM